MFFERKQNWTDILENVCFVLWCAVWWCCVNHALKINTNYSVLPDDDTKKLTKRAGKAVNVWITTDTASLLRSYHQTLQRIKSLKMKANLHPVSWKYVNLLKAYRDGHTWEEDVQRIKGTIVQFSIEARNVCYKILRKIKLLSHWALNNTERSTECNIKLYDIYSFQASTILLAVSILQA